MTISRMHIAYWIPMATNTHPEYLIRIAVRATTIARTLLNATSYVVYSLSCANITYFPVRQKSACLYLEKRIRTAKLYTSTARPIYLL
jgi:hypothetical protein